MSGIISESSWFLTINTYSRVRALNQLLRISLHYLMAIWGQAENSYPPISHQHHHHYQHQHNKITRIFRKKVLFLQTQKLRCCHLDAPLLCGPCSTGLGGSEWVRLCPGGGGGALFLDRVELPPALDCDPSGREVGGPEDGAERVTRWRDWSRSKWGPSAPEHKGKDNTPIM